MSEKLSAKERRELAAGAVFFALFVALMAFVGSRQTISSRAAGTYLLHARFNVADGLGVGAPVRVAGIRVGSVISQRLDDSFGVVVTMSVSKNVRLPEDTGASIQSTSFIGAKYIELSPGGSDEYLENGGDISFTEDSINIVSMIDKVLSMAKSKKEKAQVTQ